MYALETQLPRLALFECLTSQEFKEAETHERLGTPLMTSDKEPRHVAGLVDRFTCTWLAACGDADKSYPPSLFSFSPAYTLPLFLLSPITNTHTHTPLEKEGHRPCVQPVVVRTVNGAPVLTTSLRLSTTDDTSLQKRWPKASFMYVPCKTTSFSVCSEVPLTTSCLVYCVSQN